jgi:hypothetical protein
LGRLLSIQYSTSTFSLELVRLRKSQKPPISLIMFVHLPFGVLQLGSHWKDLLETLLSSILSFFHSIGTCRMRQFPAVLRSFFHSSLSYTFPCHSSPTILPSYLTSYHLFLGLSLNLVVSKFKHLHKFLY